MRIDRRRVASFHILVSSKTIIAKRAHAVILFLTGSSIWDGAHCKGAAASDAKGFLEQEIAWCVPKHELNSTLRLGNSI
jgi:hypothetical protein